MNLFTARLTGKMVSTEAFEASMQEMQQRVIRYRQVEKSPELKEYLELKKVVETPEFQSRKQELVKRKYSDTEEGRKTQHLQKLSGGLRMKGYKYAESLPIFQEFLAFRESEDFGKIASREERRKSPKLRKFYLIYKSQFYKNYLKVLQSQELKQLTALEAEVATEDFQQRNALWEDSKRWLHSEDYKTEQRYLELGKLDDIKFYFAQRAEEIDWAELFRPAFEDDMSSSKNWKAGFGYANPALRDGHSRTSERQAYNNGKNTFFAEGRMDIETRNEPAHALAWDEKKGFVEHDFEYTSDVMNCKDAFMQQEGLFMAKVRSQGSGHHFLGLTTGKPEQPMAALYNFDGSTHQLGLINGKNSKLAPLTGVLRSMYFVYILRWTSKELIWYVNNMEILRIANTLPKEKMFLMAQSFLPVSERGGEGKLKVQWVRIYRSAEDTKQLFPRKD